jgi:hypothetical protein
MNKLKITLAALLIATLYGCGSGSETGGGQAPQLKETGDPFLESLEGVRSISQTKNDATDESYVHISATGLITVYDYQGDMAGTGENCYTYAINPEQTNSFLHGAQISYEYIEEIPAGIEGIQADFYADDDGYRYTITPVDGISETNIFFQSSQNSAGMYSYNYLSLYFTTNLGLTLENGYNFTFRAKDNNFFWAGDILVSDLEAAMCN